MRRVCGRTQQMHGFNQTVVMIEGHDYGVRRVSARDDGDVGILNHLIDDGSQAVRASEKLTILMSLLLSFFVLLVVQVTVCL